jgi:transaldolase
MTGNKNPLQELAEYGQSVWYDNLNRELIRSGDLQRMVDNDNVTGGTSNPSIFEKAVGAGDTYDADIRRLVDEGRSMPEIYDALTITDIRLSCDTFGPVYERTQGRDGFASLEVSPEIAYDTTATAADARRLFTALARPNAMIKIPGTPQGLPAVEGCLADGCNINITLLFGVENYADVAETYIRALETRLRRGQPVDRIASVASFFVSRVDTLVDKKLDEKIAAGGDATKLEALKGKAGVANARIAYAKYKEIFSGGRWAQLEAAGARVQRCLWASTSTKNPTYRDVIYVEELIGPQTINTMPQATLDAFRDHGRLRNSLEEDVDAAFAHVKALAAAGIELRAVTDELQTQGVDLFADSYHKANDTVRQKRDKILTEKGAGTAARGD